MNQPAPPFSIAYTPAIPELLMQLNCSLVLSTFQAGKVVFLSAKDESSLVQLPRTFPGAMGIAIEGNRMAIATKYAVEVLADHPGLAPTYPRQPNTYDALYCPQATYYTSHIDVHDLHWGTEGLWAVNTAFSCLCLIDDTYSFVPRWKPPFISAIRPGDNCHLNGMAMQDGKPKYVTALGSGDSSQSWRDDIISGGVLMDVESNEIIARGLPMPHSPRIYDGKLYAVFSASGEVGCFDLARGTYDVVHRFEAFVRGMAKCGDYLFIGTSKLRRNSSTFRKLKFAESAVNAGLKVLHLPSGAYVGEIKYRASVDEIYDVQVLPGLRRPGILNPYKDTHNYALALPETTFWAHPTDEQPQL